MSDEVNTSAEGATQEASSPETSTESDTSQQAKETAGELTLEAATAELKKVRAEAAKYRTAWTIVSVQRFLRV